MELITSGLGQVLLLGLFVFVAGIVRGCIGFGFSALVVASGTQFIEPTLVIPLVVLLEIAASLQMALRAWREVRWDTLRPLMYGVILGTPLGVGILSITPEDTIRLILSLMILCMTLTLGAGYVYHGPMSRTVLGGVGTVSGIFNGVAAIGGMPVAIFLASAKLPIRNVRATMVVFFLLTELVFLASGIVGNLYRWSIVNTFMLACLPLAAGLTVGTVLFGRLDERILRRIVLAVLLVLSAIGVLRALIHG